MIGLQLKDDPVPIHAALRETGLLVPTAGGNVIRFLPPLVATGDELDEAVAILTRCSGEGRRLTGPGHLRDALIPTEFPSQ